MHHFWRSKETVVVKGDIRHKDIRADGICVCVCSCRVSWLLLKK